MTALTAEELQAWVEETSRQWMRFIEAHSAILSLPCDIRETSSVAQLLQHIVAVELRYAERLSGLEPTSYDQIPCDSAGAIFEIHQRAMTLLRPLLKRGAEFWETPLEFTTRSAGKLGAPRRVILVHLLMHSIRHYAQLATLVRQHGFRPDWEMDYLMMGATREL